MKRILFILLFISFALSLSAQSPKKERKAVREGNKAYKEQRYETAEELYKSAEEQNASSKEAPYNLANTYYKQQRWDEALKEYQHYLTVENEASEKMSAAWGNTGNTFLKKKASEKGQPPVAPQQGQGQQQQPDNLQLSMEAYKNALRLNPADDEARYNLAVVQKMIQDQQGGGGGQDDKQDKKDDKKDEKKDEQQKQEQQDKQDQQQQQQMSQQNIEQILQAIEQDERDTQERVQKTKAEERKRKNQDNRRQNKDW